MKVLYPFKSYLHTFMVCTIIVLVYLLIEPNYKETLIIGTYICGLAYVLPSIIFNPRIILNDHNTLTYKALFYSKEVNLAKLTDCSYYLRIYIRGIPNMQFHLYDADGGFVDFPANCWVNQNSLIYAIKQAVSSQLITINKKTAKKLGLNSKIS